MKQRSGRYLLDVDRSTVDVHRRLHRGEGTGLVDELAERVEVNPLDERVAAQYMLALHRSGRTAEAFEHHRRLRDVLADELGTDPSQAVQDLYQRIVQGDPALLAAGPVPRQLPAPPATFTGRRGELALLDERAGVTVITGAGGTGKTWLEQRGDRVNAERMRGKIRSALLDTAP